MSQIPTPPASPPSLPADDQQEQQHQSAEQLLQSLDTLLERYLDLLDQHQTLQAKLGKQLSNGFFSLAQANNISGTYGRRYGEDYYDERMKADRKIVITTKPIDISAATTTLNNESQTPLFSIQEQTHPDPDPDPEPTTEPLDAQQTPPKKKDQETDSSTKDNSSTSNAKPKSRKNNKNPLHWYGILVPPSLRTAQSAFTMTVEDIIPRLADVVAAMRAIEIEVERVRRDIKEGEAIVAVGEEQEQSRTSESEAKDE